MVFQKIEKVYIKWKLFTLPETMVPHKYVENGMIHCASLP